ncbi:hypothetical protein C7Y45_05090 [Brevibacillus brevis]|nr:hypothetical protein C7Y45_05090 [Lysinibacillus sp. SDF0063]
MSSQLGAFIIKDTVVVFSIGVYAVVYHLRNVGLTEMFGQLIQVFTEVVPEEH